MLVELILKYSREYLHGRSLSLIGSPKFKITIIEKAKVSIWLCTCLSNNPIRLCTLSIFPMKKNIIFPPFVNSVYYKYIVSRVILHVL